MATTDVLKEFLVSLGFKVDNSSLNVMLRALGLAESSTASFASGAVTSFAKAQTAVVGFVVAVNAGIIKYLYRLGQADLQNSIFARKMWMNTESARAFKSSIDALGVSLDDLYASPELMQKYQALNGQARGMAVPTAEYEQSMQGIRDITFEWQRMKLEATYSLQWIGYYLTKYLAGPMGDVKKWLTNINDEIQRSMPVWTARVAQVVSWFVKLGSAAWSIRGALSAVLAVFTGFKLITMLGNPFGMFILGLTTLLLLVDDFNTFNRGGKSAFPELWKWIKSIGDTLNSKGLGFDTFKKDLGDIITSVSELGKSLDELMTKLGAKDGLAGIIKDVILNSLYLLNDALKSTAMLIKEINGLVGGNISIGDIASGKADKKFESSPEDNGNKFPMDEAVKGFMKGIYNFFSNTPIKSLFPPSSIFPMSYMYPQNNSRGMTQVTMKPTYNIYGTKNPQAVAQTVGKYTTAMITRTFQGVIK